MIKRIFDVGSSLVATVARLGSGVSIAPLGARPEKPLELYDFEACPFCRKAREALTLLDLEAVVYPCPKGGKRFRPKVKREGGKEQFPYLVDPNTGTAMYESDDIIEYLFRTYGAGPAPAALSLGPVTDASSFLASAARPVQGRAVAPSRLPKEMLELWSFEGSPFCRIAREALTELEIPYLLHNVGKGSPSREAFIARTGKMMVPYLSDPNTGKEMFESEEIVEYLYETYGKT